MSGFRINPYRQSVTPYRVPIAVPICDPDFQPVSVAVSCLWLSYIVGALSILEEQATWDTTDPDVMLLAIQRATNLREIFTAALLDGACSDLGVPFACPVDFLTSEHGWIIEPDFGFGTYISGTGFRSVHVSGVSNQLLTISRYFSPAVAVTDVQIFYNSLTDGSGANNSAAIYVKRGSTYTLLENTTVHLGFNGFGWSGEEDFVDAVHVQMNTGTADPDLYLTIYQAEVNGIAAPDFECE